MSQAGSITEGEAVTIVHRSGYRLDSWWRIALSAVATAISVALIALVIAIVVVPLATGGSALTVLTGSMEPNLNPGDVAVVRGIQASSVCDEVKVGQIVSYFPKQNDPELITHRVVGKSVGTYPDKTACRLIVQGDANNSPDAPVSPSQVRGVFMYGIPKIGWVLNLASGNRTVLVIGIIIVFLALAAWSYFRPPKRRIITVPVAAGTVSAVGADAADTRAPAPPAPTAQPLAPAAPVLGAAEYHLRARELDLREREIRLREREFDAFNGRHAAVTPPEAAHTNSGPTPGESGSAETSPASPPSEEPDGA